eukprot:CAMPEP_0194314368 /NCGR_PEP_ID=MMETSP0171-20130528/11213_1 /TAXON_ID=218684 /ORGANISM="Corethron pennatum, Strain L29A3" /LENGTH=65 /DNA_ID=CAMNT_0039069755 /DNA_START=655 /DNA_END=852 /DNA_ORIENTATION=-
MKASSSPSKFVELWVPPESSMVLRRFLADLLPLFLFVLLPSVVPLSLRANGEASSLPEMIGAPTS